MNNKVRAILVTAGIALAGQASAQESLGEYVMEECAQDIEMYCSTVTPGEGRLLHCAAAHEDKLSGQCNYALYQAATLLEQLTVAINYIAESCETEIETLCGDVAAGEGRILVCLEGNKQELGQSCATALSETVKE